MIATPLLLIALFPAEDPVKPKFPVGKETTYFTGPLDKDGYVDYAAALNERFGKGITPEKNAVALLWKAWGPKPLRSSQEMPPEYFKLLGIEKPPNKGDYFIDIDSYRKQHFNLGKEEEYQSWKRVREFSERPWNVEECLHTSSWIAAMAKPLAIVIEASKRPEYYHPVVPRPTENDPGSLMGAVGVEVLSWIRSSANALVIRGMLRIGEGKYDEAWNDFMACHRLARLISRGGSVVDSLAGFALDVIASKADIVYLAHAKLTAKQIQERMKELQNLPAMTRLDQKCELVDRCIHLDMLRSVRLGLPITLTYLEMTEKLDRAEDSPAGTGLEVIGDTLAMAFEQRKVTARERKTLEQANWEVAHREVNKWFDQLVAAQRLNHRADRTKHLHKIKSELKVEKTSVFKKRSLKKLLRKSDEQTGKAIGLLLASSILSPAEKLLDAQDRFEQTHRNLRVAFALAAFNQDRGRYPTKLTDLMPNLLPSIPNDVFSGQALVYRPSPHGFLLYSVGVNGKDDNGKTYGDELGADDLRVRIPLPEPKP